MTEKEEINRAYEKTKEEVRKQHEQQEDSARETSKRACKIAGY